MNALLAKSPTYFFGHVLTNASIYMAVTAVYAILPEYTCKSCKSNRVFAIAWNAVLIFVIAVCWHHLLQDVACHPRLVPPVQLEDRSERLHLPNLREGNPSRKSLYSLAGNTNSGARTSVETAKSVVAWRAGRTAA